MRSILAILFAVLFFLPAAKGQLSAAGEIFGTVKDSNGRRLDGAAIKLIQDSHVKDGSMSDDGGYYVIKPIQAGLYSLEITNPGYAKLAINGIVIKPSKSERINFKMVPGKIDSTVTAIYNVVQVRDRIGGSGVNKRDSGFVTIIPHSKMKTLNKEFPIRVPIIYFSTPESEDRGFREGQILFEELSALGLIGHPLFTQKRAQKQINVSLERFSPPLLLIPQASSGYNPSFISKQAKKIYTEKNFQYTNLEYFISTLPQLQR